MKTILLTKKWFATFLLLAVSTLSWMYDFVVDGIYKKEFSNGENRSKNMSTMNNLDEMQQKMELQLHEQYAINNNSNLSSVVVLLAAMIAVFGGYAYLFIHSSVGFSSTEEGWCLYDKGAELYSLDAFVIAAIATSIVLHIMRRICIYQGYAQRYEQFITFAIRHKYFSSLFIQKSNKGGEDKEKTQEEVTGVFPRGYHPFEKDKGREVNCTSFVSLFRFDNDYVIPIQGLFGEFVKIFSCLQWVIIIGLFIKVALNIIQYYHNGYSIPGIIEISCTLLILIFLYACFCCDLEEKYQRYKSLENEYKCINPNNNQ